MPTTGPHAQLRISVILPCLDEAGTVAESVHRARRALEAAGIDAEILVVDNGSRDDSASRARAAGARVLFVPRRGYGNALRAGIASAAHPIVIVAGAHGRVDPADFPQLIRPILDGRADLVLGNRLAPARGGAGSLPMGGGTLGALLRRLYRLRVGDVESGVRAFRLESARRLDLRSEGPEVAIEMLVKAARGGWRIAENPVRWDSSPRRTPRLRRARRAWRHVRYLVLHGPLALFLVPGLAALALGVVLLAAGVLEPEVAGHRLSFHVSIVGGMLALLGAQIIGLGVYARAHALLHGEVASVDLRRLVAHGRTRRQVAQAGWLLALLGLAALAWVGSAWVRGRMAPMPAELSATAILGSTLVVLGFQLYFWALLLEAIEERGRVAEPLPAGVPGEPISVVVVCRNERDRIAACLGSMLRLDPAPPHEIVVVDGDSTDGTFQIVEALAARHPEIRLVSNPDGHIAAGRNRGLQAARHRRIAFTDADCTVAPGWLTALADGFDRYRAGEPSVVAVGGGNRIPPRSWFRRGLAIARSTFWGHHGSVQGRSYGHPTFVDHLPTVNVLYDRAAIEEVGGFDASMGNAGEDADLSHRLATRGKCFVYLPGCDVEHDLTSGPGDWMRKMFRYGMGRARLVVHHGMRRRGALLSIPALLVAYLPLGIAGAFRVSAMAWPIAVYLAVTLVVSVVAAVRAGSPAALPAIVLAFLITHLSYGAGVLLGFVAPRRRSMAPAPEREPATEPALSEANRS